MADNDQSSLFSIALPLLAMGFNVGTQVLLMRFYKDSFFLKSVIAGFLAGLLALLLFHTPALYNLSMADPSLLDSITANIPAYVCLSYCFFNFVNLGHSSIRIRIYSEISGAPNGLTLDAIRERYDEQFLLAMRLQRLKDNQDLIEKEGRYFIGKQRLRFISSLIFGIKKILLEKNSEFH